MSKFEINFSESQSVWDDFLNKSDQRNIFLKADFLNSLLTPFQLVTCYEGDKIVAGIPLIFNQNHTISISPFPYTQYQGLILGSNVKENMHSKISYEFKIVEFLLQEVIKKFKKICLCNSWKLNDLRNFQWFNFSEQALPKFKIDLRYTGIIQLLKSESFEDYIKKIRSVRRQEFRKASRILNFCISEDVSILNELHTKTFERHGISRSYEQSNLLISITSNAIKKGYGQLGLALHEGKPISAIFFTQDDRTAYYLFGANDPEFRHLYGGTFLMLNFINFFIQMGIRSIDMCGVNSPDRGDFKTSFNAELKPYFICTYDEFSR